MQIEQIERKEDDSASIPTDLPGDHTGKGNNPNTQLFMGTIVKGIEFRQQDSKKIRILKEELDILDQINEQESLELKKDMLKALGQYGWQFMMEYFNTFYFLEEIQSDQNNTP